jgi:hypothetical protein
MRRPAWIPLVLLALAVPAPAADIPAAAARERYLDGLLIESADGDLERAIEIYSALARRLEGRGEPELRAQALLALGRAQLRLGRLAAAQEAFDTCRRISTSGLAVDTRECAEAARRVAIEEGAVRSVPTVWTFDEGTGGFVLLASRGSMAVESVGGDGVLVWTQELEGAETPELVVGFDRPPTPPRGLRFAVWAEGDEGALLGVIVEDELGRSYRPGDFFYADATRRTWEIRLEDLAPLDPGWPPLDPGRIAAVHLRDRTGSLTTARIRHRILLDDFTVF